MEADVFRLSSIARRQCKIHDPYFYVALITNVRTGKYLWAINGAGNRSVFDFEIIKL